MEHILHFFVILACSALAFAVPAYEETPESRLVNGVASPDNAFNYAISLQASDQASQQLATRGHRCGGVLVTLQHALTAASCLYDTHANGSSILITAANFQVFAGAVSLTSASADRVRSISLLTVHPQYRGPPAHLNDIAIVTLAQPFPGSTATPLPVPQAAWSPADFTQCTVAGWGATAATAQTSTNLLYVTKYIYNQNLCTNVYSTLAGVANVFPSMVCAASYDILSTGCNGDGGNGLVCSGVLTGVLFKHNNCVGTSYPELYTRVSNYTAWVRSVTGAGVALAPTTLTVLFFVLTNAIFVKLVN